MSRVQLALETPIKKLMTPKQVALGGPIVNSVDMVLVPIPAGEFMMGSPETEKGRQSVGIDETQHRVQITKPFYLSAYEVTQQQYLEVMHSNPSASKGPTKPVENVSWNDAVDFCNRLSKSEGVKYRLPTEAEWEYACRAGSAAAYSFGNDASGLGEYAWHSSNSTHPVGGLKPNAWGLFDMHGNVWEWCYDWRDDYDLKVLVDPTGPASGLYRVARGGSFLYPPRDVRAAYRNNTQPYNHYGDGGFRLARTISAGPDKDSNDAILTVDKPEAPSPTPLQSSPGNLNQGLVAYYPFNGNAKDESKNGNDSVSTNATLTNDRFGTPASAFSFRFSDKRFIECNDATLPAGNSPRTVTLWFTDGHPQSRRSEKFSPRGLFAYGGESAESRFYGISLRDGELSLGKSGGGDLPTALLTSRDWTHTVWSFDGAIAKIFINGKQSGSGDRSFNTTKTGSFQIGYGWIGNIDDVRIYNRALSAAEVKSLYNHEK